MSLLLSPLGRYAIGAALIIGAALAMWAWADARAYRRGADAVRSAVEAQDVRAAAVAKKAKDQVDACFDEGGEWDVPTGRCVR